MKKHYFFAFFLLLFSYSYAQPAIQGDSRVHVLLQQAIAKTPGLVVYGRHDNSMLVTMAVLNTATHTMNWFTCHGRLFDSANLTIEEYHSIATGAIDPFTLYQNICNEFLAAIKTVKNIYRISARQDVFRYADVNYQAILASKPVQAAKTPLLKLMAIENMQKSYLQRLAYFNCNAPSQLANDSSFSIAKKQPGAMVKTNDSTLFYNIDPVSFINKIVLYKRIPEKLYVYNRQAVLLDSMPLLPGRYNLLLKDKTDVFLLYRGWLEMQWQEATNDALNIIENRQTGTLPELYREAYKQDEAAGLHAIYNKLHVIDAQTEAAVLPDVKVLEQAVYEQYKSEPSEISYLPGLDVVYTFTKIRGQKLYELSNHLGNVLATVSDRRQPVSLNSTTIDHYEPVVMSATDYYPFGMEMPGRMYSGGTYRYGFNGKENDNEVKGEGNQQDYGMRIYDPRVGRFLSVDPITKKYPELTPYQFASNQSIGAIDVDGLEAWQVKNTWDEHYVNLFRTTVKAQIQGYTKERRTFTCDDLALETIVAFSKANNLPFKWHTETKDFDAASSEFKSYDSFIHSLKKTSGAPDFASDRNTKNVSADNIQTGDIVGLSHPGKQRPHHIQFIVGVTHKNLKMASYVAFQGNFKTNWLTGGRLYASNDPESFRYPGVPIQQGAYVRSNDTWYNGSLHTTTSGFTQTENSLQYRQFNFEQWNSHKTANFSTTSTSAGISNGNTSNGSGGSKSVSSTTTNAQQ